MIKKTLEEGIMNPQETNKEWEGETNIILVCEKCGGSMDFWDRLNEERKRMCISVVKELSKFWNLAI